MHQMSHAGRFALTLAAAIVLAIPVGGAIAPVAEASSCVDGWQPMPIDPALLGAGPVGAASLGGAPAWFTGRRNSLAVIGRWDGATWRPVSSPWTIDSGLSSVSTTSATSAWTVGYRRLYLPRAISAHWNGTAWKEVAVPHPGGRMVTLTDVAAIGPKRALAVGYRLIGGQLKALALGRSTSGWTNISPDFGPTAESGLTAVTRGPGGRLWAVGWHADTGTAAPWIGWWDGTVWVETPAADPGAGLAYLNDIDVHAASDAYAVGYLERDDGSGYTPILQHWDGLAWAVVSTPWDATASIVLTTVAVGLDGTLIIGGQEMSNPDPMSVVATFDGAVWHTTPAGDLSSWTNDMARLTAGAFAVGQFGSDGGALATCADETTGKPSVGPDDGPDGESQGPGATPHEDAALVRATGAGRDEVGAPTLLDGYVARDMTVAAGLKMKTRSWSGLAADFNNDGWTDLFINPHFDGVPKLELGSETGFAPMPTNYTLTDRYSCTTADVTGEGKLDIFCPIGRRQGTALGGHEFMVNVEDGGTPSTAEFGLLDITGRGRASAFVHLESDLMPALFVANWPFRIDGLPSFNRFYRGVDGTHYVPAPEAGLDRSEGGQCVVAANVDADADDELLVCATEASGGLAAGARLYDWDGTGFVDRTIELGLAPMGDVDIEVADFDGDTLPDIAQLSGSRLRISLGTAEGGFTNVFELGITKSVKMAVGDVNADSRPDIYVSRHAGNNDHHLMLVNGGDGRSFESVAIPEAHSGSADDVLALDYDNNGLTDFFTLNGFLEPGPVKLIAFFPAD
jgi:hypothetical protein